MSTAQVIDPSPFVEESPKPRPDPREVPVGSLVLFLSPGSRATDGAPREIPAVVLDQNPQDGVLTLFAFHFEGQYMARAQSDLVRVLFDPRSRELSIAGEVDGLKSRLEAIGAGLLRVEGMVTEIGLQAAEHSASGTESRIRGILGQLSILRKKIEALEKPEPVPTEANDTH